MGNEPNETKVVIRQLNQDAKEKMPFEHVVTLEYYSEMDGKDYTGKFIFKKFRLGDYGRIAALRIRLNGGQPDEMIDPDTFALNNAIAHCHIWFAEQEDKPSWAKDLSQLYDPAMVYALHKEGIAFENSFRKPVAERSRAPESARVSAVK